MSFMYDLPPAIYDHAFPGQVNVHHLPPREIQVYCGNELAGACTPTQSATGTCIVYVAMGSAFIPDLVQLMIRHETGHCNGWPADHPSPHRVGVSGPRPTR